MSNQLQRTSLTCSTLCSSDKYFVHILQIFQFLHALRSQILYSIFTVFKASEQERLALGSYDLLYYWEELDKYEIYFPVLDDDHGYYSSTEYYIKLPMRLSTSFTKDSKYAVSSWLSPFISSCHSFFHAFRLLSRLFFLKVFRHAGKTTCTACRSFSLVSFSVVVLNDAAKSHHPSRDITLNRGALARKRTGQRKRCNI